MSQHISIFPSLVEFYKRFTSQHFFRQLIFRVYIPLFFVCSPSYAVDGRDIRGIALGDSLDNAVGNIKLQWPTFIGDEFFNPTSRNRETLALTFSKNPSERGMEQISIAATKERRIWFVGRAIRFQSGERPDYGSTLRALFEKYGEPSMPPPPFVPQKITNFELDSEVIGITWKFDDKGRLIKLNRNSLRASDPCFDVNRGHNLTVTTGISLLIPVDAAEHCGVVIRVALSVERSTQRMSYLSTTLVDVQAMLRDPALGAATRELIGNERRIESEKGQKLIPKL